VIVVLAALFLLAHGRVDFLGPVAFFALPLAVPLVFAFHLLTGGTNERR
jgi:hypothetical protein